MHPEELKITQDQTTESIILRRIFNSIVHKWWLICIVGLMGGIIGFIYAKLQKPIYESYLSFALDEGGSEGGASGAMGLAAQFGISIGGSQDVFTGDNILEIMQSRRVIERALLSVDSFDNKPMTLIEYYLQKNPRKNNEINIHFYPGEPRSSFSYLKDSILYNTYLEFKNYHITARRPDKRLNIYELLVTSKFEEFSKVFTDKLILETNSFYTEIRSKKSKETLEILEKRVPDMKEKLDETITNKAAIQDANLNTAFANARIPLLKQESNGQVYAAAYAEMFRNLELARFQYLKSIPLMQIIDNADYPMKKIKMSKLKTAIIFSVMADFIFLVIFIIMNFFRFRAS